MNGSLGLGCTWLKHFGFLSHHILYWCYLHLLWLSQFLSFVCVCVYHHSSISTLSFPDTITLEDQACWRTIITYSHIINDKWAAACWFNGEVMMKYWFLCYIDILCMHICLKIWLQTHDCSFSLCACSGQRVIVQEKNEEQVVENVVTIQVGWNFKASYLLDKLRNENVGYSWI